MNIHFDSHLMADWSRIQSEDSQPCSALLCLMVDEGQIHVWRIKCINKRGFITLLLFPEWILSLLSHNALHKCLILIVNLLGF